MRVQTSTFLFQLRQLLYTGRVKNTTVDALLKPLAIYVEHLCALPIADVLHTIHSSIGNESTSPAYHLMHGHLEWRWFYLTLKLRIEQERLGLGQLIATNSLRGTDFEEKLKLFIYDLIVMSAAKFNKVTLDVLAHESNYFTDATFQSDFSCTFRNCRPKRHLCASATRKCGWWFSCLSRNYKRMAANWIHFGSISAMYWNNFEIEKVSSVEIDVSDWWMSFHPVLLCIFRSIFK